MQISIFACCQPNIERPHPNCLCTAACSSKFPISRSGQRCGLSSTAIASVLSFAQTGLDFGRPTTDLGPGLVRLINLDTHPSLQPTKQSLSMISSSPLFVESLLRSSKQFILTASCPQDSLQNSKEVPTTPQKQGRFSTESHLCTNFNFVCFNPSRALRSQDSREMGEIVAVAFGLCRCVTVDVAMSRFVSLSCEKVQTRQQTGQRAERQESRGITCDLVSDVVQID
jgi:hypothetical protein